MVRVSERRRPTPGCAKMLQIFRERTHRLTPTHPHTHTPTHLMGLLLLGALLTVLPPALGPVSAQSFRVSVANLRREPAGRIWGAGNWMAFSMDEEAVDLNRDGDKVDSVLTLVDQRTLAVHDTGIAIDFGLADDEDDWPIAFSGDLAAVQVSEADQGKRDLDGNGSPTENVLALYDATTRQLTNLGVTGRRPAFLGGRLYFSQPEPIARKDLNADGDTGDLVLCVYDPATRQTQSLGMECGDGFQA